MATHSRAAALLLLPIVLTVAACAPSADPTPAATVIVTAPPSPPVVPTPNQTPAETAAPFAWAFGDQWLSDESVPRGSGCAPGSGPLPDGVWFGFIEKWSTSEISFDLACWWSGDAAAVAAGWGPEDALDFYISNDNNALRKQPVAPGATALKAGEEDGVFPLTDVIADPGGTYPTQQPYPAWLFINDGVVTSVAVQFLP